MHAVVAAATILPALESRRRDGLSMLLPVLRPRPRSRWRPPDPGSSSQKTSANFHHSASVSGCSGTRLQLEQRLPKLAALLQRLQSWGGRQTTLPLLADTWDGLPSRGPTPAPSHDG
ncbi:MAG: hypothetical protein ACPIOQ_00350 [Promethearchaeia archaeon]